LREGRRGKVGSVTHFAKTRNEWLKIQDIWTQEQQCVENMKTIEGVLKKEGKP